MGCRIQGGNLGVQDEVTMVFRAQVSNHRVQSGSHKGRGVGGNHEMQGTGN